MVRSAQSLLRGSLAIVSCAVFASTTCWSVAARAAAPQEIAAQGTTPQEIAALIDRHLQTRWTAEQVSPAPRASDGEFLRRAWLDLAGKIPTAGQTRAFLEDTAPDKRERLIAELLSSPRFVVRTANQWTELLVPEGDSDYQLGQVSLEFRHWLHRELLDNVPYDEMVRQILTVPLNSRGRTGAYAYYSNHVDPLPTAFYAAKDTKPENLAAATARVFLGIRVECAQCHDHPHGAWKREQFWGYAAFFQGLQKKPGGGAFPLLADLFSKRRAAGLTIAIPDSNRTAQAQFLDGSQPSEKQDLVAPRWVVADWMVSADNPYFARAAVNRIWAELLGTGLVHPVDDMDPENPPSHPELLDALSGLFAHQLKFDQRTLYHGIALSSAYQMSSLQTDPRQEDPALFARFKPRRLSARQMKASLQQVIGDSTPESLMYYINADSTEGEFDTAFRSSAPPTERVTSVQQALLMMNGQLTRGATNGNNRLLSALRELPGLTLEQQIDSLYVAALSREPRAEERQQALELVASVRQGLARNAEPRKRPPLENPQAGKRKPTGGSLSPADQALGEALGDLLWALLNSTEFAVQH